VTVAEACIFDRAIEELEETRSALRGDSRTEFSAVLHDAWETMSRGEVDEALAKLQRARALSESLTFDDTDRAEVLFRLGCCRLKLGAVANAVQLFTVALELADRSGSGCDRLRNDILRWRTRCYRRQRDWDAARADADAALELAEHLDDVRRLADSYLQASQVAERTGQLIVARFYLEHAVELLRAEGDLLDAGKALNNLGGILFLLGREDDAKARLDEAFEIALELGDDVDAAYAVSSSAQVLLEGGDAENAEARASYALELLGARRDHAGEIGGLHLVRGRALIELERFDEADEALRRADDSFRALDSPGHRARAWLAQGDLAARLGRIEDAAASYRRAAETLQDVRF
jgi:tetratricopeptide (TPR) repeat protein